MATVDGRVDSDRAAAAAEMKEVRAQELEEVVHRRREALPHHDVSPAEVRENLVGLALSGGGIRSASLALGVLQSLHSRRILPFIDYLSTVSGGGYAGVYISSAALKAGRRRQYVEPESGSPEKPRATTDSTGNNREKYAAIVDDELFPIAHTSTGQPQEKMLRFIHGGNYLRKTWVFINRYLIGLVLIWAAVISGLVAATSFTAWAFRSLDHTSSRGWIAALGFEGEIKLAFFPSFVLLIVWLILWSVSYFKFGARSTGIVARGVFVVLVFVTLVAIAALLGNGQYAIPGLTGSAEQQKENTTALSGRIYTIVFLAVAASLLPYLRPARLVRSGTAPKNTAERYVFWVATRALAFGVPFIFVAFFARENISDWNERRDDRLTRAELNYDNHLSSPLWHQVAAVRSEENGLPGLLRDLWGQVAAVRWGGDSAESVGNIWRAEDRKHLAELAGLFRDLDEEDLTRQLAASDFDKTERMIRRREDLANLRGEFSSLRQTSQRDPNNISRRDTDTFANETDNLKAHLVESAPQDDSKLTFPARWWHLAKYVGESIGGDTDNLQENPVYRLANEYVRERDIKWDIARLLNERLEVPQFYVTLLPDPYFGKALPAGDSGANLSDEQAATLKSVFLTVKQYHPEVKFETWHERLRELRLQAIDKQTQFDPPGKSSAARLEDLGHVSGEVAEVAEAITKEERTRLIVAMNRQLLEAFYGNLIDPKSIVYSSVVLAADQERRMQWFLISFALFITAGLCVDLNATSLHGFYSTQIGKAWIEDVPGLGRRIPLARMETSDVGCPYHLVSASLRVMGKRRDNAAQRREGFLFSKLYCGSDHLGYARTADYMNGAYTLDDAIAVSGAAVSPMQTTNPLVIALLTLFNVRLGQWVANPSRPPLATKWVRFVRERWPITPFRVLFSMFKVAEDRPTCFVTDGGHHENLALEPLLARRCRLILAMDAGCDEEYQFSDLARLIRTARISHGIRLERLDQSGEPIDLGPLTPSILADEECADQDTSEIGTSKVIARGIKMSQASPESQPLKWSERHFVVLKIKYPALDENPPTDGYLIYMKSTLTGDEPVDLRQFNKFEPVFPHNPTADQFYDPTRFDAYVQLGYHIANQIGPLGERFDQQQVSPLEFIQRMAGIDGSAVSEQPRKETRQPSAAPIDKPLTTQERKMIEDICARDDSVDEDVRQQFEQLGVRLLQAAPQLLKAHQNTQDPWLQKVILKYFLDNAETAFPHLCKVVTCSRDPDLRVAALWFLNEFQNPEYGVEMDELREAVSNAKRSRNPTVKATANKILDSFSSKDKEMGSGECE